MVVIGLAGRWRSRLRRPGRLLPLLPHALDGDRPRHAPARVRRGRAPWLRARGRRRPAPTASALGPRACVTPVGSGRRRGAAPASWSWCAGFLVVAVVLGGVVVTGADVVVAAGRRRGGGRRARVDHGDGEHQGLVVGRGGRAGPSVAQRDGGRAQSLDPRSAGPGWPGCTRHRPRSGPRRGTRCRSTAGPPGRAGPPSASSSPTPGRPPARWRTAGRWPPRWGPPGRSRRAR